MDGTVSFIWTSSKDKLSLNVFHSEYLLFFKRNNYMDFSISNLIPGLLFSIIGWWVYREGKRNTNITVVVIGILLMTYSWFTNTPLSTWGVGIVLSLLAYKAWN